MQTRRLLLLLAGSLPFNALALEGLQFHHKDWELACDNTGTCRAAGYQADVDSIEPISVLLEREAGTDTPVTAQVKLSRETGDGAPEPTGSVQLQIGQKALGTVSLQGEVQEGTEQTTGRLDAEQTLALLQGLKGDDPIRFSTLAHSWELSSQGANAVLLKMDEFQQRVGTSSALIQPGTEVGSPLQPQPAPVIQTAPVPQTPSRTLKPGEEGHAELYRLLDQARQDRCSEVFDEDSDWGKPFIRIHPLSDTRVLVESLCWRAAYNEGYLFALMDAGLSQVLQVYDIYLNDYVNGRLEGQQKARGLGDCWIEVRHVWDGQNFVRSLEQSTGMCRGFPGGAWRLPIHISQTH